MIGLIAAAAIALLPTGNYSINADGGASCGATTVPVLELGQVVCEAPSQILASPTLYSPQVGYGYPESLGSWYGSYPGLGLGLGLGLGGFGHGFGGHHHCTTVAGVRTCS